MKIDYLLKGGYVIDGRKAEDEPARADVAVAGDRIVAAGDLSNSYAEKTIDVNGLYVCPGFIDVHAHSDFVMLADGRAEGKVCQGVTTEINGNCGLSAAPLFGAAREQREKEIAQYGIKERWSTFPEYFSILERRRIALNVVTLVGHGNLRASVAGYEDRPLSDAEMQRACELLKESMVSGAKGLSTGLIYPPGVYADTEELILFAGEVAKHNGIYTSHMRSESDYLLESIEEVIRIADGAKVRAHISHLKTSDEKNWGKITDVFKKIEEANAGKLSVTCDRYPYIASSTDLDTVLPSWAFEGGHHKEIERLKNARERLTRDILQQHPEILSVLEKVFITSVLTDRNKWVEGKSIAEISRTLNKAGLQCIFDLLLEEDLSVGAVFFVMSEDNLKAILGKPYTMIGSDGTARCFDGITATGVPHPRGFGSFPRVLGRYVRDEGIMPVSEAVYKMTGLPAKTFHIDRRGIIAEGYYADITIFDPETVSDTASYNKPFQRPDGVYHVLVNGTPVVLDGELTRAMPGRVLR